ncbi:hypothetical protein GCM10017750_46270 [Streptomyces racemochromogenes]
MAFRVLDRVTAPEGCELDVFRHSRLMGVLAALLVSPGQQASRDDLNRWIWGDSPKKYALTKALSRLGSSLPGEIATVKNGEICSINVPPESVDYLRFRHSWAIARDLARPAPDRLAALRLGMREWSPREFLGGLTGEWVVQARSRLRIQQKRAAVELVRVTQALGDLESAITEAEQFLMLWPTDEQVVERLLDCIAAAHGTRAAEQRLADWYAEHPDGSPRLRAYIRDLATPGRSQRVLGRAAHLVVPRELPSQGPPLRGRDNTLDELVSAIGAPARTCGVFVITGMPGVGKTALVRRLANLIKHLFPDGSLHLDLQGFTSPDTAPLAPEMALSHCLTAFGLTDIPSSLADKAALFRSILAERSVLVVLDNARNSDQIRSLIGSNKRCATLITSRDRLCDLTADEEVHVTEIRPLANVAAKSLLVDAMHGEVDGEADLLLEQLVQWCSGVPLALQLVAARLRNQPPSALGGFVSSMGENRAAVLDDRNRLAVWPAYRCSYQTLSPDAGRLLWQLTLYPGADISWGALADIARAGAIKDVHRAAEELVTGNLLECSGGAYRMHDLIRAYATELAEADDTGLGERTRERVFDHLLQNVWACDRVLAPDRGLPIQPCATVEPIRPKDENAAMAWLQQAYGPVMAAIRLAREAGQHRTMWLLSLAVMTYQWRLNLYAAAEENLSAALHLTRGITTPEERSTLHRMLAGCCFNQGRLGEGVAHLHRAIALVEGSGAAADRLSLGRSLHTLGLVRKTEKQEAEAMEHLHHALDVLRPLDDHPTIGAALECLAEIHCDRGEYDQALDLCFKAQAAFQLSRDRNGRASVQRTFGTIHQARSEPGPAQAAFRQALSIYKDLRYDRNIGRTLCALADLHIETGAVQQAREALEEAHTAFTRAGDGFAESVRHRLDTM